MPHVPPGRQAPSASGTVAYIDLDGMPIIGVNSDAPGYTSGDDALAHVLRSELIDQFPDMMSTTHLGRISNNAVFHAEANAHGSRVMQELPIHRLADARPIGARAPRPCGRRSLAGVNEQSVLKITPPRPSPFLQSGSYMVAIAIHQMARVTLRHFVVTPTGFEPVTLRLGMSEPGVVRGFPRLPIRNYMLLIKALGMRSVAAN